MTITHPSLRGMTITHPSGISIIHGRKIVDRKSIFQGHVAEVKSVQDVKEVQATLYGIHKFASATHNILAYRLVKTKSILNGSDIIEHDHDSDGESGAGKNMQWLLDTLDALNIVVIISRWYGGISLGPDRFRHINVLTKEMVDLLANQQASNFQKP